MASLKGVRILLTGGTGFLGRHLMPLLQEAGAIVQDVSRRLGYDLRNENEVLTALLLAKPSIIVHLAGTSECPPGIAYRDTVLMGMNVVHAAAIQNASQERVKLVMIGHPASYPTLVDHPDADEETFWNGAPLTSTYAGAMGAAKKSLLQACEAYQVQYGLDYSYLIPENLYGPYENRSIVAQLVAAVMEAKTLKKKPSALTLPSAESLVQPLLYVADAAKAILRACEPDLVGGPINLPSSSPGTTIGAMAKIICSALEYTGKITWAFPADHHNPLRPLKIGRAEKDLSWSPETTLEAGINQYIDWCWRSVRQPQAANA